MVILHLKSQGHGFGPGPRVEALPLFHNTSPRQKKHRALGSAQTVKVPAGSDAAPIEIL